MVSVFSIWCRKILSLLLWGSLLASPGLSQAFSAPETLVRAFQQDYLVWNNEAYALNNTHPPEQIMPLAQAAWNRLLEKYTLPDFKGEPIAFGSESAHHPEFEKITSVHITAPSAVIKTQYAQAYDTSTYAYHLILRDHRWYLTQVYFIDEDGKYPGL